MLINIGVPADWNDDQFFADMMLCARAPGSPSAPWDQKFGLPGANIGPDQWPLEDFGVCVATPTPAAAGHLTGTHILTFAGRATVSPIASGGVSVTPLPAPATGQSQCKIVCDATANQLYLAFTGTSGVHNVTLIRDGCTTASPTNPRITSLLKNFTGFRWMDTQGTNNSGQREWIDRPRVGDALGARTIPAAIDPGTPTYYRGVPLETLIAANVATNTAGWFCVPHMASDDYIHQMAALFAKLWTHGKPLYIQYSNEVGWNFEFAATHYLETMFANDWTKIKAFIGTQTVKIGDAFKAAGVKNVVPVLAGQIVNLDWCQSGINAIKAANPTRKVSDMIGAIAGARYIWSGSTTAAAIEADLLKMLSVPDPDITAHQTLAAANGIDFVQYEYGIDQGALSKVKNDPGIAAVMQSMVGAWNSALPAGSNAIACYYVFSGGGFGVNDYGDAPTAAFTALSNALIGGSPVLPGIAPLVINANDPAVTANTAGGSINPVGTGDIWMGQGGTITVSLAALSPGDYTLALDLENGNAGNPTKQVGAQVVSAGAVAPLPDVTAPSPRANVPAGTITVVKGSTLFLTAKIWGWHFRGATFTPASAPVPPAAPTLPDGVLTTTTTFSGGKITASQSVFAAAT